jgi:hypothetical protein
LCCGARFKSDLRRKLFRGANATWRKKAREKVKRKLLRLRRCAQKTTMNARRRRLNNICGRAALIVAPQNDPGGISCSYSCAKRENGNAPQTKIRIDLVYFATLRFAHRET